MVVKPKIRGFICTTAHPLGCKENIKRQIEYIKSKGTKQGAKKVLIIGSSTGYGLASRIAVTYGYNADTLGIMFEKPSNERRTATAGWYNTKAFEEFAAKDGHYAKTINGDAFSSEIKQQTVEIIKKDLKKVDMVIYSLAAPRRTVSNKEVYNSVLKTTDKDFTNKSLDLRNNTISQATISCANKDEINDTIKVMGGEDWQDWIQVLVENDVIEDNALTIAYSYIGPKLTYPVYFNGTIGKAKEHLYKTSVEITNRFKEKNIKALISVNKALVTQASAAIPIVPLYMAILYKVMKDKNIHEGCIEQMGRLISDKIDYENNIAICKTDEDGKIRLDDYEMREDVQSKVMEYWDIVNTENVNNYADIDGYWKDFNNMFGFGFENIDYEQDVEI